MNADTESFVAEITDQAVLEVLESIAIPPCPEMVLALTQEMRQAEVDFKRLAALICADVAIAASVLQAANAPFFGLRGKVGSVQQALSMLGLRNLLKIVYGVMLSMGRRGRGATLERFWDRSRYEPIAVALLATRLTGIDADLAYTYALFHDMGIAVLMQEFDDYRATLAAANATAQLFTRVEDERHKVNHAMAGAMFAREWQLPTDVCWAVFYHHDFRVFEHPTRYATETVRDLIALGLIAEHIVAHFLGRPDEMEWLGHGDLALAQLGLERDRLEDARAALTPALEEARAERA